MPGDADAELLAADRAARGLDADDLAAVARDAGDLAVLDDVDPARVGGARVAPGNGIVARGAAARLHEAADDRVARAIRAVEQRHEVADLVAAHQLGVDAIQPHGIAAALEGVELGGRVREVEHAALAEHDVEVELGAQALPELERELVEMGVGLEPVVRAHDRGVAPGVAAAEPALLEHRDVGDAVLLGEVVGGRQAMAAATHNHDVVSRLRLGAAPGRGPARMVAQRIARQAEEGIGQPNRRQAGVSARG